MLTAIPSTCLPTDLHAQPSLKVKGKGKAVDYEESDHDNGRNRDIRPLDLPHTVWESFCAAVQSLSHLVATSPLSSCVSSSRAKRSLSLELLQYTGARGPALIRHAMTDCRDIKVEEVFEECRDVLEREREGARPVAGEVGRWWYVWDKTRKNRGMPHSSKAIANIGN